MPDVSPAVRLLAFDLDGTLLSGDKTVTPRTLAALAACRAKGLLLAVATGRSHERAREYLALLLPDAAVLNYGAHILLGESTVYRRLMSPRVANAALRMARGARDIHCLLASGQYLRTGTPREGAPPLDRNAVFTERVANISAFGLPEAAARALPRACGCAAAQIIGSQWCSYTARGTGKGPGIRRVMRLLGVAPGQGVGFGDEDCDIALFRALGAGVAMANGDARTRQAADFVTADCEADGVARYLERFIL